MPETATLSARDLGINTPPITPARIVDHVAAQVISGTDVPPAVRINLPPSDPLPENATPHIEVDDEYRNKDAVSILRPLRGVQIKVETSKGVLDFDGVMTRDFEYYSRTRDLEIGTERVQRLQEIVNQGTAGSGKEMRVVIMNKGEESDAFAMPDGTIFISQSLINKLDSLDEVVAVLGHESGHVLADTFGNKVRAGEAYQELGVGHLHEMLGDHKYALEFLEKTGFNTTAYSTAIEKVAGSERGTIHQSGIARASQSIGVHMRRDFITSSKERTALPQGWKKDVRPTNLEMVERVFHTAQPLETLTSFVNNLHPRDFGVALRAGVRGPAVGDREPEYMAESNQALRGVLHSRLSEIGHEGDSAELAIILATELGWGRFDEQTITRPEEFERFVPVVVAFSQEQKLRSIIETIFDKELVREDQEVFVLALGKFGTRGLNGSSFISSDAVLRTLINLQEQGFGLREGQIASTGAHVLLTYADRAYLCDDDGNLDEQEMRAFFVSAKEVGLKVDPDRVRNFHFSGSVNHQERWVRAIPNVNKKRMAEIFEEVFRREALIDEIEVELQECFIASAEPGKGDKQVAEIMARVTRYVQEKNLSDQERLALGERLMGKVESTAFPGALPLLKALADIKGYRHSYDDYFGIPQNEQIQNVQIRLLNLQLMLAAHIFAQDTDTFYTFIENGLARVAVNPSQLTPAQNINLATSLFAMMSEGYVRPFGWVDGSSLTTLLLDSSLIRIQNFDRLVALPYMKEVLEGQTVTATDITTLNEELNVFMQKTVFGYDFEHAKGQLFGDNIAFLLMGRPYREQFVRILEGGVQKEDYQGLFAFVEKNYPDGAQKHEFLAEVNKRFLEDPQVSLQEKTDYLVRNFEIVGIEGILTVGDQIEHYSDYLEFRGKIGDKLESYFSGGESVTNLAAADIVSSYLGGGFSSVLRTCVADGESKFGVTNGTARAWIKSNMGDLQAWGGGAVYDASIQKFVIDGFDRQTFRSFSDVVSTLTQMSPVQRWAVAHKLLTETGGALSTDSGRQQLSDVLLQSLGVEKGFVGSALDSACKVAEARVVGFPAAKMLTPLLFRSLDMESLDIPTLLSSNVVRRKNQDVPLDQVVDADGLKRILLSSTRDIVFFGKQYRSAPNSVVYGLAEESDQQYRRVGELLQTKFKRAEQETTKTISDPEIPDAIEAAISGVEAAGPLGARTLQMSNQLVAYSPAIHKRTSRSFDSNKGIEKVAYWENLHLLSLQNPDIADVLSRMRVLGYAGGGSLYTSFFGELDGEEVVVKMLNPNSQEIVKMSNKTAKDTLEDVKRKGEEAKDRELVQNAEAGLTLIDFAKEWCLRDINDPSFEIDDARFRVTTARFNKQKDEEVVYAPTLKLTKPKLKIETKAPGQTLNKALQDESLSDAAKNAMVQKIAEFCDFQLNTPAYQDEQGRDVYLIHSDPNPGNFIVDGGRVAVIDRNMYLRLHEEDVRPLRLLNEGKGIQFMGSFVNRVMDTNKVRGLDKLAKTARVQKAVVAEVLRQRMDRRSDEFAILRTASSEMESMKVEMPFEMRLMLRNIQAQKELRSRRSATPS